MNTWMCQFPERSFMTQEGTFFIYWLKKDNFSKSGELQGGTFVI